MSKQQKSLSAGERGVELPFETKALSDDSLEMGIHLYLDMEDPDIEKSVSIKSGSSIKTGILYRDGSFGTRSCFKGYSSHSMSEVWVHKNRPRDRATMLLIEELGWTQDCITE